jgi:hypothetical protein
VPSTGDTSARDPSEYPKDTADLSEQFSSRKAFLNFLIHQNAFFSQSGFVAVPTSRAETSLGRQCGIASKTFVHSISQPD